MNTTHTPETWRYSASFNVVTASRKGIIEGSKEICAVRQKETEEETQANGLLLAASKDMLAALIEAKKLLESVRHRMPKSIRNSETFHFENILANSIGKAIQKATQP